VWLAPNTQQLLADAEPALDLQRFSDPLPGPALRWRPSPAWAAAATACVLSAVYFILAEGYEEFIYRFF